MSQIRIVFDRPLSGISPLEADPVHMPMGTETEFVPLLDPIADKAAEEEGARRAVASLAEQIRMTL